MRGERSVWLVQSLMSFSLPGPGIECPGWQPPLDCEAADEETATAALLHLGSLGSIRTRTARAYDAAEMQKILALLPK